MAILLEYFAQMSKSSKYPLLPFSYRSEKLDIIKNVSKNICFICQVDKIPSFEFHTWNIIFEDQECTSRLEISTPNCCWNIAQKWKHSKQWWITLTVHEFYNIFQKVHVKSGTFLFSGMTIVLNYMWSSDSLI